MIALAAIIAGAGGAATTGAFAGADASGAAGAGTFTISRSGLPATNDLTVNFTIGGTATPGSDYEAIATSVTLPSGQSSAQVVIVPLADTIKGFKMIVNGECDQLPEQAFYMVGTIEEAFEKAKTLQ